jgi:hypothetical protein
MVMLFKLAALGAIGFAGFKIYKKNRGHAAFAGGQPQGSHTDVREAGPQAMADPPKREWTKVDENSDESFPASDPPGNY